MNGMLNDYEPMAEKVCYLSDGTDAGNANAAPQLLWGPSNGNGGKVGDTTTPGGAAEFEPGEKFDALTIQIVWAICTATGFIVVSVDRAANDAAFGSGDIVAMKGQASSAGTVEFTDADPPIVVFKRGRKVFLRAEGATGAGNSSSAIVVITAWKKKHGRYDR